MTLGEYQKEASKTAIYPHSFFVDGAGLNYKKEDLSADPKFLGITYAGFGLSNEVGELLGKLKKIVRDKGGIISEESKDQLKGELSDVLWYIAAMATELDLDLDEVAEYNIAKLKSRQERGVLKGDGDNR